MNGQRIRVPLVELLCSWISEAWGMITTDDVIESFKNTGTSHLTEDHLVWDADDGSEADEDCSPTT